MRPILLLALCSCSPAQAREPLPDLSRELAELDRALPVLLEARATERAAITYRIHTRGPRP